MLSGVYRFPAMDSVIFGKPFVDADLGIPKGSGCINSVYGKAVLYRPNPGFVGKDRFTYNVPVDPMAFEHLGRPPGPWTVFITVREKN